MSEAGWKAGESGMNNNCENGRGERVMKPKCGGKPRGTSTISSYSVFRAY